MSPIAMVRVMSDHFRSFELLAIENLDMPVTSSRRSSPERFLSGISKKAFNWPGRSGSLRTLS
jgi:hypothetical protein